MEIVLIVSSFILAFASNRTEEHLRPNNVSTPILFNIGKIISYSLMGCLLGLIGFVLKVIGFTGGILLLVFAFISLLIILSRVGILPRVVLVGIKKHHYHSFGAGLQNILASSSALHILMFIAIARGYFLESGLMFLAFALGSLYLPGKKYLNFRQPYRVLKGIILLAGTIFIAQKGLLYSELYLFSPFENSKTVIVPESLDQNQFIRTKTSQLSNRLIMNTNEPLNWMIQGESSTDKIYIPRYRHSSYIGEESVTLKIEAEEAGFIYFTDHLGKGDHIIKVVSEPIDVYNLPYAVVMDSGYEEGLSSYELPAPYIDVTLDPGIADQRDGKQFIDIIVGTQGYTPNVIILKKGVDAVINFKVNELTESNSRIIMPSYNEYLEFIEGDNPINLHDPLIDFIYYNWKGEYGGYILIVDDPELMTRERAERQIKMLNVNGI